MKTKLTAQQEKFCQEYAKCGNGSASYRLAYHNSKKWKDKSVWEGSSKLVHNAKVSTRIKELQEEMAKKELWTKEKSVLILKDIAEGITEDVKPTDRTNAVKELNKMHGFEAPKVLDHQSSDGTMSPTRISNVKITCE